MDKLNRKLVQLYDERNKLSRKVEFELYKEYEYLIGSYIKIFDCFYIHVKKILYIRPGKDSRFDVICDKVENHPNEQSYIQDIHVSFTVNQINIIEESEFINKKNEMINKIRELIWEI